MPTLSQQAAHLTEDPLWDALQVPDLWHKMAYPSLKPLSSWFDDYLKRIGCLRTWLLEGTPACFWLSGFFFPQGFITGVLQMHARKYSIPIDALTFGFKVSYHSIVTACEKLDK